MKKTVKSSANELIINIEVDEIHSFDTLNMLADAYIEIASKLAEYSADCQWNCPVEINVITPEGVLSEEEVFTKFTSAPALERKAVSFIYQVTNYCKATTLELWGDEENPLGEPAAYVLCMHDAKYIPLYIELLLQNDLDHEVHQGDHIENIIEKYGLTSDVLRLMAHRTTAAAGQWGDEQVKEHRAQLLELFLNRPEQKSLFLNTAMQSLYHAAIKHGLYFDFVRDLSVYIEDEKERSEWLQQQEEQAKEVFGNNIKWHP